MGIYSMVSDTAELKCSQGTATSNLQVTGQNFVTVETNKAVATADDVKPQVNIKPFGSCKLKPTSNGFLPCVPKLQKWQKIANLHTINDVPMLVDASFCPCLEGGKITIENVGHNEKHFIEINDFPEEKTEYGLSDTEKTAQSGVQEQPKSVVVFDLSKNFDWSFGFDSFDISKKGCKDKDKLKKEYKKYTIADKEYLAPWVSMRQGQSIKLAVKLKGKYNNEKITMQSPYFLFSPQEITQKTEEIQITCTHTFLEDHLVEAKVGNNVVGAIYFMENTVKRLKEPIRWVITEFNEGDEKAVKNILKQELETYLKKAFIPALIDIDISSVENKYIQLSDSEQKRYFDEQGSIKHKVVFFENLKKILGIDNSSSQIVLLTSYLKSQKDFEDGGYEANNGSTYEKKIILMFFKNESIQPYVEIPHEVMHALGLEHTFAEDTKKDRNKKHIFNKGRTRNYMDYQNTKEYTQKWQWEIMRKSQWVLSFLLCFFLFSCKSYKSIAKYEYYDCSIKETNNIEKSIDYEDISCLYDYSVKEKYQMAEIIKKYAGNDKVIRRKSKGKITLIPSQKSNKYAYVQEKDTLGIPVSKIVLFDKEGRIKEIAISIGNITNFVKQYVFDDNEKIVKEVDYDNEKWNLCWLQAVGIVRRFISNELKDTYRWNIAMYNPNSYYEIPYTKKMWFVSYHYRNCRFVVDIDDEMGKIVKYRKIPVDTYDELYSEYYFED